MSAEGQERVACATIMLAAQVGRFALQLVVYEEIREALALGAQVLCQLMGCAGRCLHLYLGSGQGIQRHGQERALLLRVGVYEQAVAERAPGSQVHIRVGHIQPEHCLVLGQHRRTPLEHSIQRIAQLARIQATGNHQYEFVGQATRRWFLCQGILPGRLLPCPASAPSTFRM